MADDITPELEAVAKAIYETIWGQGSVYSWEVIKEANAPRYRACFASARAALSAIRDPTEGMLQAMHHDATIQSHMAVGCYRDMIDHILGSDSNG